MIWAIMLRSKSVGGLSILRSAAGYQRRPISTRSSSFSDDGLVNGQSTRTAHAVARFMTVFFKAPAAARGMRSAEKREDNSPNQQTEEAHPTDQNEKQNDKKRSAEKPGSKASGCLARRRGWRGTSGIQ